MALGLDSSQSTQIVPATNDFVEDLQAASTSEPTVAVPSSPCLDELYDSSEFSGILDGSIFDQISASDDCTEEAFSSDSCDMVCDPESHPESLSSPDFIKDEPDSPIPVPSLTLDEQADVPVATDGRIDGDGEFEVRTPAKGKALYTRPVDATDRTIQKLFPEWTLRLERNQFNAWKKKSRIRKLSPRENELLKKYRRTMLARVYADRARHRRAAKHGAATSKISTLQKENVRLRQRVAELERRLGIGG